MSRTQAAHRLSHSEGTKMERKTRFELATFSLARRCSTTEPLPLKLSYLVGKERLELSRLAAHDPKSCSSASSDTPPAGVSSPPRYYQSLTMPSRADVRA